MGMMGDLEIRFRVQSITLTKHNHPIFSLLFKKKNLNRNNSDQQNR